LAAVGICRNEREGGNCVGEILPGSRYLKLNVEESSLDTSVGGPRLGNEGWI
jgi:hypothetical protein